MAGRSFITLEGALDPGVVVLGISWAPNGAGAVDQTSIKGRGVASVALTGTAGVFLVTLQDVYPTLLSATATLQLATADDKYCILGSIDLTAKTITVAVWDVSGAATANVNPGANNRINLTLVLKNSGV